MVLSIGCSYFKAEPKRIQMIGFMIILNPKVNELYQLLYNDSFVEFYNFACIFFAMKNKPVLAAAMLSMAISIKAGAVLMLPSLLGWIQY
jgi:Gpi18-like mannosyltransferase